MIPNDLRKIYGELDKTAKITLIVLGLISVLFLGGAMVWINLSKPSGNELILKEAFDEHFNGKVDSIYNDAANHNEEIAVIHGEYLYGIYREWAQKIQKGDSLCKKKNSYQVIVIKQNNNRIILDYRDLVKSRK